MKSESGNDMEVSTEQHVTVSINNLILFNGHIPSLGICHLVLFLV